MAVATLTQLTPQQERNFQKEYARVAEELGLSTDPDDPRHFYDYRGLFKEEGRLQTGPRKHFPSKFKLEGHPNLVVGGVDTKTGIPIGLVDEGVADDILAPAGELVDEGVPGVELPEVDAITGAERRVSVSPLDAFERAGKEWDLAVELGTPVENVRNNFDIINSALNDEGMKEALGSARPGLIRRGLKKFGRSFVNMLVTLRTKSQAGKLGIELGVFAERIQSAKDAGLIPENAGMKEFLAISEDDKDELFGGQTILEHIARKTSERAITTPGLKATDVPPALTIPEKATEVVANVSAFVTKLAITRKLLGPAAAGRNITAWETLNLAEGGIPGAGAAMYVSLRGIDKIPIKGAKGFFVKTGSQSALFAGTAAVAGGDAEAIATAALLPWALRGFDAAVKGTGKLARVKLESQAVRNLRDISTKNGIDLTKVPDSALKLIVSQSRQARFWNKQFDKGKITEDVLNQRLHQIRQRIAPVLGAIAKQQPVEEAIVKAEPSAKKPPTEPVVKPPPAAPVAKPLAKVAKPGVKPVVPTAKPEGAGEAEGGIRADTIQEQAGIKLEPGTARRVFDESKTIEQRRQLIKDADFEGLITNPERLKGEKVLDILAQPPTEAKPTPVPTEVARKPIGPKPPITILKPQAKIQRPPEKKPPTVAMRPGFIDFGPLVDAGPQVKQVSEKATKLIRRFGGLDPDVRKVFIEYEEQLRELPKVVAKDAIEKFGHLSIEEETLIQQHREQPKKFPDLPDDLTPTLKVLEAGIEEYGRRLEELGYPADWPNTYLKRLEKKLERELGRDEVDVLKVTNLEHAIEEARDLQYLHHFYETDPVGKRIIGRFRRSISKRPRGVLGRTIPTLEKAKELGLTPAPLAVSYAHMAHEVARAELANDLITAINLNKDLSLPEDLAPKEWVRIDERIFPASVQHQAFVNEEGKPIHIKKFRKYPIPIAEALEEIAYTRNFSALERAYDKLNFGLKIIGFYNPIVMTKNDAVQLWRAGGVKGAIPLLLPQMEGGPLHIQPPKAIQIWAEKGPEYQKLRKAGLFNNIVSYKPAVVEVTQNMLNHIRETSGEKAARIAAKWLNPVNIPKNLRAVNDMSTWNMDEIMRIAAYEAVKDTPMLEGMTDFEKIEWVNDAMVNYGSIPKETKRWINKAMFTPSYRVGNFSFFWRNVAPHPWRMKGPLLRTVGYKMFIRWGLPAIVSAAIAYKINEKRDVRTEKGYKLVIHNPATNVDTVYSLSDPLLEGVKITQRPFTDTIALNLAPVPSLLIRLLGGPRRRQSRDPFGEFFKLGTPVYRDIVNWTDPDKTVPQKLLTQFAIAYVYTRRGREEDKDKIVVAMAKTLAIWTDWKEQAAKVKQVISGRSYYLGPGGKFGRLMREWEVEQDIDRDATDVKIDSLLNRGLNEDAIRLMAESDRYETAEGVSGRILKHRAPIFYYWQVMSKSDRVGFLQWLQDNNAYSGNEIAELRRALERSLAPLERIE